MAETRGTGTASDINDAIHLALYDGLCDGVASCRVIFENDVPVDCEFVRVDLPSRGSSRRTALQGRRLSELVPPSELRNSKVLRIFGKVAQGGEAQRWSAPLAAREGWSTFYAFSPALGELILSAEDISECKRTMLATRESEERLRVALAVTGLLVFHQDRDLRYTWIANPVLGVAAEEALGRRDDEMLGPEAAAPLNAIKQRVLRSGNGERHEVEIGRAGHTGCFDLIVEPRRDECGNVIGLVCAATDITERRSAAREVEMLHSRLRRFTTHLQELLEAERRQIARDVHDQIGALLTAMRLKLTALASDLSHAGAGPRRQIGAINALAEQAMAYTHDLCARLRPAALDDLGLAEACRGYLREWAQNAGIRVLSRIARLKPEPDEWVRIDVYRILQELLTNVARHAHARTVRIGLSMGRRGIRLAVADDGRGFDAHADTQGFGMTGIKERVARHGGRCDIASGSGGTTVTIAIPLRSAP